MEDKITGIVKRPIDLKDDDSKEAILKEARERADKAYDYSKDNLDRAETDVNFIFGDQYDLDDEKQREEEGRLNLKFNKLPQFINKVVGAQRSSVDSIKVTTTGASIGHKEPKMTTGSGKEITVTSALSDLIRDIEYQSNAIQWYKMAFKHAVEGGFGYLRVLTQYQDDGFDLDIRIKGIRDRWSVLIDPKAVEPDRSDMNYAFVSERISLEEFNKRYPHKAKESITPYVTGNSNTFWGDEDTITITEYFRREPYQKTIVLLSNGETHDKKDIEDLLLDLESKGITIVKERKAMSHKVIWCKLNAREILEEEIEFPTSTIPIIPVLGRETDFRTKKETKGLIHDAIDAQRSLNIMRSSALESIDQAPLSPWIASDKSIEGHEQMWANANTMKFSTLVYKKGEEKPSRLAPAPMPVAELQIAGTLDEDMKGSIGIFNASLGATSNEISGKAIKARQMESDVGTYEFIDNYKTAIRRVGLVCTELIPKIFDTERIVRLRGADGGTDTLEVNKVVKNTDNGQDEVINDLNYGKFSVVITSGVSYETKREENADKILELMKFNPQVAQVGADLLVRNLDFADSDVLAERLEKMIPTNLLSPEKQEEIAKDQPEPQPSPEQVQAQADMETKKIDLQMKQEDNATKLEIEKIRLQIAQTNLFIKQVELENEEKENARNIIKNEEDRKNKVVENMPKEKTEEE